MATAPYADTLFPELDRERDERQDDLYPTSDGLALMGTSWHEVAIHLAAEALRRHFRGRDDLFIAAEMALYYEPAPKQRCLYPDLMVAFGVEGYERPVYKVWQEGRAPQFVLEVASRKTKDRDCKFKKREYERLGVQEYWQLDQTGELPGQPLIGHRLRRGRYERLEPCGWRDGAYEFRSAELGLLLRKQEYNEGLTVVFHDRRAGRDLLAGEAMDDAFRAANERAQSAEDLAARERKGRLAAEDQVASERRARLAAEERTKVLEEQLKAAMEQMAREREAG